MRGHVRKRGATWAVVVDIGRDPATGKRRQRWHFGFKTKKEAERALTEILGRIGRGEYVEASKETLGACLEGGSRRSRRGSARAPTNPMPATSGCTSCHGSASSPCRASVGCS